MNLHRDPVYSAVLCIPKQLINVVFALLLRLISAANKSVSLLSLWCMVVSMQRSKVHSHAVVHEDKANGSLVPDYVHVSTDLYIGLFAVLQR